MIRRIFGVLLALIGLILAVVGGAAAFWLIGPDNTVHSGEQHLAGKGLAVASTPDLLNRHGPVLHVDVRSSKNQPVFVGVARDFDVSSYLKGIAHTKLVQVQYPIALSTQDENGTAGPLAAPDTLDWWVTKANGTGTQSLAWPIEDGPYDVVIMNADGKTAPDVQVDLGIEIPKAFATALVVFAAGIVLLAIGILLILIRRRPRKPQPTQNSTAPQPVQQPASSSAAARRVVVLGLAFGLTTGCSAVPPADTVTVLTRPAISEQVAAAAIKHYDEVSNAATKRRDEKLIATVETGDVLRLSQAGYRIDRVLDKAGKDIPDPTTHVKPSIGVPSYGGYPMRFVASAGMSAYKDYQVLDLWERRSAGDPWLVSHQVTPEKKVKLPPLKGLRPLTAADNELLAASPEAAGKALAGYLNAGTRSSHAALFAPSADITDTLNELATAKSSLLKNPKAYRAVIDTFTPSGSPAAFLTTSGEALVFLSLTEQFQVQIAPNLSIFWGQGSRASAFSPPTKAYDSALTSTILHQVALVIPRKGAKIRVLAATDDVVQAGGF
ncbi:hypothetical protein [Kribbella sp. VKM Ac-2571]|uniref:hypothetical protein n=1 Tax=Kribbella sp. VKM Ac-2571 TaxID=2512222 RepID=UPI00105D86D4|nr:hypothetical protein [Kribbella sp. VKM Ac-2571]